MKARVARRGRLSGLSCAAESHGYLRTAPIDKTGLRPEIRSRCHGTRSGRPFSANSLRWYSYPTNTPPISGFSPRDESGPNRSSADERTWLAAVNPTILARRDGSDFFCALFLRTSPGCRVGDLGE